MSSSLVLSDDNLSPLDPTRGKKQLMCNCAAYWGSCRERQWRGRGRGRERGRVGTWCDSGGEFMRSSALSCNKCTHTLIHAHKSFIYKDKRLLTTAGTCSNIKSTYNIKPILCLIHQTNCACAILLDRHFISILLFSCHLVLKFWIFEFHFRKCIPSCHHRATNMFFPSNVVLTQPRGTFQTNLTSELLVISLTISPPVVLLDEWPALNVFH